MTAVFNPHRVPSVGSDRKTDFRINEDEFGDGYSQATPVGLNTARREVSLSWNSLPQAEATQITDFLNARGGAEHFTWTFPTESAALKWRCLQFNNTPLRGGRVRVSATFKQVYNL